MGRGHGHECGKPCCGHEHGQKQEVVYESMRERNKRLLEEQEEEQLQSGICSQYLFSTIAIGAVVAALFFG
jgi:hypothetical protein